MVTAVMLAMVMVGSAWQEVLETRAMCNSKNFEKVHTERAREQWMRSRKGDDRNIETRYSIRE